MSIDEALSFLWYHVNKYPSSLVSGIELALLDIQGKMRGCPIHQLLFACSGQSDTYTARQRVSVNAVVGAATLEATINEGRAAVSKGFDCVKLKVAGARLTQGTGSGHQRRRHWWAQGTGQGQALSTSTSPAPMDEQATIERIAAVRQALGPAVH